MEPTPYRTTHGHENCCQIGQFLSAKSPIIQRATNSQEHSPSGVYPPLELPGQSGRETQSHYYDAAIPRNDSMRHGLTPCPAPPKNLDGTTALILWRRIQYVFWPEHQEDVQYVHILPIIMGCTLSKVSHFTWRTEVGLRSNNKSCRKFPQGDCDYNMKSYNTTILKRRRSKSW